MPASPIRKLAPLADAAKQRGVHVFHLNIGQPDLPTPQAAIDAIRNIDRKVLEYSPSAGYRSYREKLVGYYAKFNINLTADDIIITSGGSEAVLFSFLSCLNPGDEIIVPEPAYANYMAFGSTRRPREANKKRRDGPAFPPFPVRRKGARSSWAGIWQGREFLRNPGPAFLRFFKEAAYSSGAMFGSLALAWFRGLQLSGLLLSNRSW